MNHSPVPSGGGLFGSVMGGITSFLFLGVALSDTHPNIALFSFGLSTMAALLSIFCSIGTLLKFFR